MSSQTPTKVYKRQSDSVNSVCRFCSAYLGLRATSVPVFSATQRQEYKGVKLSELLSEFSICLEESNSKSKRSCQKCSRQIVNSCKFLSNLKLNQSVRSSQSGNLTVKRLAKSSPSANVQEPAIRGHGEGQTSRARKKLSLDKENIPPRNPVASLEDEIQSLMNIDVGDHTITKVLVGYPKSMVCREMNCTGLQATLAQRIGEGNYRSAISTLVNSSETEGIVREVLVAKIAKECRKFGKTKSSINTCDPVLVSEFRNVRFVKEVEENTPFLYSALQGAVKDATNFNEIALGAAACISTRTKSSAFQLRNSVILQHGGCKAQDMNRLNKLGICSSHKTAIRAQTRMGEGFDDDLVEWKHDIEKTKKQVMLLEDVMEVQIPALEDDDMEVEVLVDFTKETLSRYKHYSETTYQDCLELLEKICQDLGSDLNQDVLQTSLCYLKSTKLPTYRIVTDNINLQQVARIQSKSHQGNNFDWSNQFAVRDRVLSNDLSDEHPQQSLKSLDLSQIIPSGDVLSSLRTFFIPLVGRVLAKYMSAYKVFKDVVIHHIPHENSDEMAKKSEECYMGLEFLNPNKSVDMAQLLKTFHEKYVPTAEYPSGKQVLYTIPLDGDQLTEERARNVQWTYRLGANSFDRLEGLETNHADWHWKVKLLEARISVKTSWLVALLQFL